MEKILKKFIFSLSFILIIWFIQKNFTAKAYADIITGDAISGSVVINCVNTILLGTQTSSPCPVFSINNQAVTPTPTTSTSGTGGVGVGGGGGGGESLISTSCSDPKPNGTPRALSASTGPGAGQITLSWGHPAGPFTTYSITYSDNPNTQKWGVPSTGIVNSYTVSGLLAGNYYFWVRAVDGCTQGDPAGPVTVRTAGRITVLAAVTSPTPSPKKEVLGEGTYRLTGSKTCGSCIWLPVILGEAAVLFLYFFFVLRKKMLVNFLKRKYALALIAPVAAYIVFLYLNKGCLNHASLFYYVNSGSFFCRYFLVIDVLTYAAVSYLSNKYLSTKNAETSGKSASKK